MEDVFIYHVMLAMPVTVQRALVCCIICNSKLVDNVDKNLRTSLTEKRLC
jgi:hypothetical protein